MSLIFASKALQLCRGSAGAPLKCAKNLTAARTGPAKIVTHKLSSSLPVWPAGVLQSSLTSSKIQHTHPATKWSQVRAYTTQPGAQNEEAAWSEAKSVVDQLKTFSVASKKKIGDWLEANEVTLDTLASYADPAKEARDQHLPQGPFVALVRKAKEMRASDDVKKAIELVRQLPNSESDTTVLVDWILANSFTLATLASYADPAKEATENNLPRGPLIGLVKKVKEVQPPKALTLEDVYHHAQILARSYSKSSTVPESTYIRRKGAHEVALDLVERQNLDPFSKGETRPNAYKYGVIGGAVGAGKTRMAKELLPNLRDELSQRHPSFYFSYVRVVLPSADEDWTEERTRKELALNLAIGHFYEGVTESGQGSLAQLLLEQSSQYANLDTVERLISQSAQIGSVRKCVILHLDECQKIPKIIESYIKVLERRLRDHRNIHLLPLFVGLSPSSVVNIGESSYTGTRIPLPLLDDEDSGALLHDFCFLDARAKSIPEPSIGWAEYCRNSKHFPQLLRLFAGHPQVLRLLAGAIVDLQPRNPDHLDESAAAEALAAVKKHFRDLYYPRVFTDHPLSSEGAASLIKMAFFGEVVPVNTKINGLTVADVEKSGLISTVPEDPSDPLNVRVAWPLWTYFWLDSHLKMNIFSKQLEDTIFKLDSTNLPKMMAHLHLASIHILTNAHPTTTTTMQYLYFDQLEADQELLDTVITLKASTKIKEAYLTRRSPQQPWEPLNPKAIQVITSKATTSESVDLSTGRFIVVTPPRYPGADVLLPYAQEQYKGSLDMDQMNPIPATKILTTSEVNVEIGKFVVPNLPLIFVSPKPYKGSSPYRNVGFVCGDNFFRFTRGFVAATTDFSPLDDMQPEQDPTL